jgi:2-polyprenyl-6-methoxyphenol hydroxylase-like FAD-dependent oxidoreductase
MSNVMAGKHVVVIGASVAGLLAARVLSESFDRVTVYDRDELPDEPLPRRGVPQSRHGHGLHARGAAAMDELLPGFFKELVAAGGIEMDYQSDITWYLDGYRLSRARSGLTGVALTRRLLEWLLRQRVESLESVRIVEKTTVDGLSGADGRVTGVLARGQSQRADEAEAVAADLVVDASGRGSRAPAWLRELGYGEPDESAVRADVVYMTRHYRASPEQLDGKAAVFLAPYPGQPRGSVVIRQEDSKFVVVCSGQLGVEPPADDEGMLGYVTQLGGLEIAEVMRESEPIDEAAKMRFPASVWHHYEQMARRPERFLVMGDALCSFNPIYGQGMTTAALEALALRDAAAGGLTALPQRFYSAAGKIVSEAWALSAGGDLAFPEIEGKRPPGSGLVNWYLHQFRKAASVDPVLGRAFVRVVNMVDPPASLLRPPMLLRVLRSARKARPAAITA